MNASAAVPPHVARADWRRWLGLVVVLLAAFMDFLDASIVAVAAPTVRVGLRASYSEIQWVVAGYTLALALTLITGSRLGDTFGRRRMFVLGMSGFTAASALCGAAQSPTMLIASRVVQGLMAGAMLPQVLTMIQLNFPREEQSTAYGLYGAMAGLAYVGAPLIGALLIQADVAGLSWRTVFLLNVPVCALALAGSLWLIDESKSEVRRTLDLAGVGLLTVGLFLLIYPLVEGRTLGWPAWTFLMIGGSFAVLVAFVWYERRILAKGRAPLVALDLFRLRTFAIGAATGYVLVFGVAAFVLIFSLTLQIGYGFTPLHLALTLLPWPAAFIVGSGISSAMPTRGRRLLGIASLLLAASMCVQIVWLGQIKGGVHFWQLMPAMVVGGLGAGFSFPAVTNVVLTGVGEHDAGSASGLVNTTFQLGAATGVAVIGAVFFGLLGSHSTASARTVAPQVRSELRTAGVSPAAARELTDRFTACFHAQMTETDPATVPSQCRPIQSYFFATTTATRDARRDNFRYVFRATLWSEVAVFALGLTLTLTLRRRSPDESGVVVGHAVRT